MSDKPITPDIVRRVDALKQSLYRGDPRDIGADSKSSRRCEDCRFVKSTRYGGQCVHPEALVAVWDTAAVYASSCTALRHADDKCGPEGRLFEATK